MEYSIGEFSQVSRLTVKTLRFYQEDVHDFSWTASIYLLWCQADFGAISPSRSSTG